MSSDCSVPVHYCIHDGSAPDSTTHIGIWECIYRITGRVDFIYVADSKLCVSDTMHHIAERGGRFITILPSTRKEEILFRDYLNAGE